MLFSLWLSRLFVRGAARGLSLALAPSVAEDLLEQARHSFQPLPGVPPHQWAALTRNTSAFPPLHPGCATGNVRWGRGPQTSKPLLILLALLPGTKDFSLEGVQPASLSYRASPPSWKPFSLPAGFAGCSRINFSLQTLHC